MKESKRESGIESLVFYAETLRLVRFYLQSYSFETPADSLQYFVDLKASLKASSSTIERERMEQSEAESESAKTRPGMTVKNYQRTLLLEEIRILILSLIPTVDKRSREVLQIHHLYIHLIELTLDGQKSKYQKVNEFLNANFTLDEDDLIGHACRGNYGSLVKMDPALGPALEELNMKGDIEKIQRKYRLSSALVKVLSGRFRDIKSSLELDCYSLLHRHQTTCSSELLQVFDGNFSVLQQQENCFTQLVFLLAYPTPNLRELEKCFEGLFLETFEKDYVIGLDFLSFSRKCQFYFPYLIKSVPLNCVTVESLIRFTAKNKLSKELVTTKFASVLQEKGEYDQLCRFILNNKITDFEYSKEFMRYFADNYDRFRFFISGEIVSDDAIKFIGNLSRVEYIDEISLQEVFRSKYFLWFADEITNAVSSRGDLSEKAILELINILFERETEVGVSLKEHKHLLTKRLLK